MFLKIPQISQENTCWSLFLIKLHPWRPYYRPEGLTEKRLQHRCFPQKFAKILRTTVFYLTPPVAPSAPSPFLLYCKATLWVYLISRLKVTLEYIQRGWYLCEENSFFLTRTLGHIIMIKLKHLFTFFIKHNKIFQFLSRFINNFPTLNSKHLDDLIIFNENI